MGARIWGRRGAWDFNAEAGVQAGRFGAGRIRAWDAATDNGLTLEQLPLTPRIGLRADATSGDRDPGNPDLETFNPRFPNTAYSGLSGLVGPANSLDLVPSVRLSLAPRLALTGGIAFFWRTSVRDGLYGITVAPVRTGGGSRARFVGRQTTLELVWRPDHHLTYSATLTAFATGRYLRETPPGESVRYVQSWVSYRF